MDGLLFVLFALFIIVTNAFDKNEVVEQEPVAQVDNATRVTKINENYLEDQQAFMRIASALGFPKEH